MTGFVQILSCILVVNLATCSAIGEFSIKKNFNFEFKPLPFKPLHFIKEKWSPFGKFGVKHGIEKRDLDKMTLAEGKGVTENRLPVEIPLGAVTTPNHEIGRVPLLQGPVGPNWLGNSVPLGIGPVPAPPPPEVIITPPPPKVQPAPGMNTNIASNPTIGGPVNEPPIYEIPEPKLLPHEEINSIEPPVAPIAPKNEEPAKEEDNPFVRGSKLAIYFGNLLLDIMARFLGRPVGPVKE